MRFEVRFNKKLNIFSSCLLDIHMHISENIPISIRKVEVFGNLEFQNGADKRYVFQTNYMYVSGGLYCGAADNEFEGQLQIILNGTVRDPDFDIVDPPQSSGVDMGSKAIGTCVSLVFPSA